jgi:hypothetical protein
MIVGVAIGSGYDNTTKLSRAYAVRDNVVGHLHAVEGNQHNVKSSSSIKCPPLGDLQ